MRSRITYSRNAGRWSTVMPPVPSSRMTAGPRAAPVVYPWACAATGSAMAAASVRAASVLFRIRPTPHEGRDPARAPDRNLWDPMHRAAHRSRGAWQAVFGFDRSDQGNRIGATGVFYA